jgi:hypothetical protein
MIHVEATHRTPTIPQRVREWMASSHWAYPWLGIRGCPRFRSLTVPDDTSVWASPLSHIYKQMLQSDAAWKSSLSVYRDSHEAVEIRRPLAHARAALCLACYLEPSHHPTNRHAVQSRLLKRMKVSVEGREPLRLALFSQAESSTQINGSASLVDR